MVPDKLFWLSLVQSIVQSCSGLQVSNKAQVENLLSILKVLKFQSEWFSEIIDQQYV